MAKKLKTDSNKTKLDNQTNTVGTNTVVEMKNDIKKDTASAIIETTTQVPELPDFFRVTKSILSQKFGMSCDIREVAKSENFKTFHITKKSIKNEADGQIRITVGKDCKFNIQLNPYDHYGEYSFQALGLDTKELNTEFDNFLSFIHKGEFVAHGKFTKEVNYDPNLIDDHLLSRGY